MVIKTVFFSVLFDERNFYYDEYRIRYSNIAGTNFLKNQHFQSKSSREKRDYYAYSCIPVKMERTNIDKFIGMFSDGKLSGEKFIQNKKYEKELEK
jgi:hypothetical protein